MFDRKKAFGLFVVLAGATACAGQTRDARLALDADEISALDRMTAARCERAQACGATEDPACFDRLRVQTATELGLSRCAGDVHQDVLQECVRDIRRRACDDHHDSPTLFWACRVGALCTSHPDEGSA